MGLLGHAARETEAMAPATAPTNLTEFAEVAA
jgi:hypothetical protein